MINVFIFVFNRPDILEFQLKTLKKFIKNELKITVVQDKYNSEFDKKFEDICNSFNLPIISYSSPVRKNPSDQHGDVLNYVYNNFINNNDVCLFLDHDMFAIDEINFNEYLFDVDIVGLPQARNDIEYFWPGLFLFKYNLIKNIDINFSPIKFNDLALDTGGGTYKLFESNLRIRKYEAEKFNLYVNINSFKYPSELHLNGKFLHIRNASQWDNNFIVTDHDKTDAIKQIINNLCT